MYTHTCNLADQGLLSFKSPAAASEQQLDKIQHTMDTGESSKQAPKETMVKHTVFNMFSNLVLMFSIGSGPTCI